MKKHYKNYLSLLLLISIFLGSISLRAINTSVDEDFLNFYTSIKNIQSQLGSISFSIYANKRENKPLDSFSKTLKAFEFQIDQLNSQISAYAEDDGLDTIYTIRLETLSVAAQLLTSLLRAVEEQLLTSSPYEEYQLLKAYLVADSLLNQTLSYFPSK